MFIDSHAHLTDERYTEGAENIISKLKESGIDFIINVGYDEKSSEGSFNLSEKFSNVFAAVAVHPHDSKFADDKSYGKFRTYAAGKNVVAIGETGLDYYYDHSPRETQKKVFVEHLKLADELRLPVIIHLRDAFSDMLEILRNNKSLLNNSGVLHSYSGSAELVNEFLKFDLNFSFSGPVTFKNARGLLDTVKAVPLDRILSETDCPYLTPEPFRGRLNYPAYVKETVKKIAEIKEVEVPVLCEIIKENTLRIFKKIKL